jgi:hypothetical protein
MQDRNANMIDLFSYTGFDMCSICPTYVYNAFPNHATRGAKICTIDCLGLRPAFHHKVTEKSEGI